jgi:peptide/nickel transport system substrate-binding protein
VVGRYSPGEELLLTARDDYWGGPVCIPQIRVTHITGGPATYEAMQAGEVDVAVLRDPAAIAAAEADGTARYSWVMNLGEILLVNHGVKGTTPATADVTVRQAIAAAIDTTRVDAAATGGAGIPGSAIFASGGALDPGVPGPAYDPDHARELVEQAKAAGWDGEVDLSCDNARTRQDISIAVAAQLEAAGIVVNLDNSRSINDHVAQALEGNFELACWGINVNDVGAWAKLDKQLGGASTSNFAGYVDADWDAALADLRTASTPEEQRAATARLQERANETIPVIVLSAAEEVIAVRDGVDGLVASNETLLLFGDATIGS